MTWVETCNAVCDVCEKYAPVMVFDTGESACEECHAAMTRAWDALTDDELLVVTLRRATFGWSVSSGEAELRRRLAAKDTREICEAERIENAENGRTRNEDFAAGSVEAFDWMLALLDGDRS